MPNIVLDGGSTMTATYHDDQLEIYLTTLNELNCTFGVSFHVFMAVARDRHGHGLWPSWFVAVIVVSVMVVNC